nr:CDKN2A-interacting protein isoform X2 [Dasypus novemcinctus]
MEGNFSLLGRDQKQGLRAETQGPRFRSAAPGLPGSKTQSRAPEAFVLPGPGGEQSFPAPGGALLASAPGATAGGGGRGPGRGQRHKAKRNPRVSAPVRTPGEAPRSPRPGAGGAERPPPPPSPPRRRGRGVAQSFLGEGPAPRRKDARERGYKREGAGAGRKGAQVRRLLVLLSGARASPGAFSRGPRCRPRGQAAHRRAPRLLAVQRPLAASATRRPNMAQEVSEFLSQNPRAAAWVEALRSDGETDKHWRHRREFLLRNAGDLLPAGGAASAPADEAADAESGARSRQMQQLVSFSMAWANHVFLGCRYPQKVMDKILSMAEGIKVTDAPIHTTRDELVAKVKKRGISSSNG